jgi:tRNA (guanine-N7-)-methyltransferase
MHQKYLPSFAKRNGRITNSQKKNLELFKSFEIKNLEDLKYSLKKYSKCALEIGFGNGENLINQAILNPNTLHIGSEVYKSGIGSLIGAINQKKLSNIKIYQNDVRDLFDCKPEEIFDLIIIICPDPWPKEKHHKRRLINKEFLQMMFNFMKENSYLHISTDWQNYAESIEEDLRVFKKFSKTKDSMKIS